MRVVLALLAVVTGPALTLGIQRAFAATWTPAIPETPADAIHAAHAAAPFVVIAVLALRGHVRLAAGALVAVGAATAAVAVSTWSAVYGGRLGGEQARAYACAAPLLGMLVIGMSLAVPSARAGWMSWRALVGLVSFALVFAPVAFFDLSFGRLNLETRANELMLQRPDVYMPAGKRLALLCQSDPDVVRGTEASVLPAPLRSVRWLRTSIDSVFATVELGGSFYSYGYDLRKDSDASTERESVWQLVRRAEGEPDQPLATVRLDASARATRDDVLRWQQEAFAERRALGPLSIDEHRSRMHALVLQHRVKDAQEAAEAWIAAEPEVIVPRLARAHLMARQGMVDAGGHDLARWVDTHPTFEHRSYVFLFFMRENRARTALDALDAALREPLGGATTGSYREEVLARDAAVFAFLQHELPTCLAVCVKVLASAPQPLHRRDFLMVQAAALALRGDQPAALVALGQVEQRPRVLDEAIRRGDTATLWAYARWSERIDDWAHPLAGGPDGASTLYAPDWRSFAGRIHEGAP